MNIIVVGCGRVGAELAYGLYRHEHHVTVIDEEPSAFENLPSDFRGRTVEGEVLAPDVLHRAGIETAQGMAAVTSSDSLNAVVAHLARTVYKVPNTVVRLYDPRQRPLIESFALQIVSPSTWGAQRIEEILIGVTNEPVYSAGNGEVQVFQIAVPQSWNDRRAVEMNTEGQRVVVAVTRSGRAFVPTHESRLQTDDIVYVSAIATGIVALHEQMGLTEG
jgi:trk system potassium uptake protein TrkA